MKKILSVKRLLLADLLLAGGMSAYWLSAGLAPMETAAVFISIFFAGCPLPYFLSTSVVLHRAVGAAEKQNIRIKSPDVLNRLQYIDTLALSKNGTVTEGKPYISDIVPEGMTQSALLALAASVERDAVHPIGQAIFKTAMTRRLRLQRLAACTEIPGCGVEAIISGKPVRVGRLNWLKKEDVDISASLLTKHDKLAYRGKVPVFVSNGKYARGIIALEDSISPETIAAIHRLQKFGIRLIMLTSDSQRTAAAIKKATDIDEIRADLSPLEKIRELQLLRSRGANIAAAGNPESDQAIFTEADLSIQLIPQKNTIVPRNRVEVIDSEEEEEEERKSEDVPESEPDAFQSDLILKGSLRSLIPAMELAREVHRIIRQNHKITCLAWLLLLPPAMGLLTVFGGSFLDPDIAFGGCFCASLLIFLNSLRAGFISGSREL